MNRAMFTAFLLSLMLGFVEPRHVAAQEPNPETVAAMVAAMPDWMFPGGTNALFLSGTTQELFEIRAAYTHLFCDASLAQGWSGCNAVPVINGGNYSWYGYTREDYFSAPFDTVCEWGNCTDGKASSAPWKATVDGSIDCITVYGPTATVWNDGWGSYLGQSSLIDLDETSATDWVTRTLPTYSELLQPSELPYECRFHVFSNVCLPSTEINGWNPLDYYPSWETFWDDQCMWSGACCVP